MERWINAHSVNCYFCGKLFDKRDGHPADGYNGGDGGSICHDCQIAADGYEKDRSLF